MTLSLPAKRFILAAVDTSPQSLAALEAAARVAAHLNAEVRAMYVEDINLVRTAELPFARAIASSGQSHPLTPGSLEHQLRRQADIARRAVETACTRSAIAWSFSVVRGAVIREIVRAASAAEIVTVGRSGSSGRRGSRMGSVTRSLLEQGAMSLLMVGSRGAAGPIVVVYDGSPSSDRALALAVALAENHAASFTVILAGESRELGAQAAARLEQTGIRAVFETFTAPLELIESLCRPGTGTMVVPATVFADTLQRSSLVESLSCSVFVVR